MQANQQMSRPALLALQHFVAHERRHERRGSSHSSSRTEWWCSPAGRAGPRRCARRSWSPPSSAGTTRPNTSVVPNSRIAVDSVMANASGRVSASLRSPLTASQSHDLGETGQHGQAPEPVQLAVHRNVEREPAEVAGGVGDARRRARRFAQHHRRLVPPSPAAFDVEAMLDEVHMLGVRHLRVVAPRVARKA